MLTIEVYVWRPCRVIAIHCLQLNSFDSFDLHMTPRNPFSAKTFSSARPTLVDSRLGCISKMSLGVSLPDSLQKHLQLIQHSPDLAELFGSEGPSKQPQLAAIVQLSDMH